MSYIDFGVFALKSKYWFFCILILIGAAGLALPDALPVSASGGDGIRLPIIMYHSILQDTSRTSKYVVTPDSVRADFEYLREHGYESVTVADLENYVFRGGSLPEKPVMITLDDGYCNNLTYLLPLLEEYDFRAVISVVGEFVELYTKTGDVNPNYAHLGLDSIAQITASGRVEIQNHTYGLHKLGSRRGAARKSGEDAAAYEKMLSEDLMRLQTLLLSLGILPTAVAYPYGAYCAESEKLIRSLGFVCSLTCNERVSTISKDPESLFELGRFNRDGRISTEKYMLRLGIV